MDKTISATEFKNKVSEVLNDVHFHKKTVIIKRYGKLIAKIRPYNKREAIT